MIVGSLEIQMMADVARLTRDMDAARRTVSDATSSMARAANMAKMALGAIAGAMSVAAFAGLIKGAADATAGLHDMSIQTGASVASLRAFKSVAATTDTTIEGIGGAMNKLAKGMLGASEESKGIGQAIKSIGLDFDALKSMAPEQQMLSIAKALDGFENGAGKSAVAMTLFGKQGATMLPFLQDLADQSGDVAAMLTEQEVATQKAAAALADDFGDNLAKINKLGNEWARDLSNGMMPALVEVTGEILKAADGASGFAAAMREATANGTVAAWARESVDWIKNIVAALAPAAKVAAAYFATFVAAPAIYAAVGAAVWKVVSALAVYAMNVAIGQANTISFNTALFGTSVAANLASGALTKMRLAGNLMFAAFAGWELGSYLNDRFVQARIAGEVMAGALVEGWENVKYGAIMSWEAIKYSFISVIGTMKGAFADFLTGVGKGLRMTGATDTGNQIVAYADGLRKAASAQTSFAERTKEVRAEHEKSLKVIDMVTQSRIVAAQKEASISEATTGAPTPGKKGALNVPTAQDLAAIKAEADAYQSLVAAIGEKIAANKLELAGGEQLTDAQKMTIKLDEAIAAGKNKLTPKHIEEARAMIATVEAQDKAIKENKFYLDQADEKLQAGGAAIKAAIEEAEKNELLVKTFGLTKAAIEGVELARLEERLAQADSSKGYTVEIAQLDALIDAKRRNIAAVSKLGALDTGSDVTRAKELLDILTAVDAATKSAATGMAESFGRVGSAIGGLTTALTGYAVQQQAIVAQLAAAKADPKNGPDKIAKLEIAAANASAQAKMKSYGDMAGAAKGFFKENTKGYKVMEGAEKAFRAYEMAMAVQSMVKKIFFKEGEVAANLALNGVKLTGEAATTTASVGLAATESSAWGITAVVKALASLPFPLNLAAGAATLAAVVAIGASMMGGIGGGASPAPLSEDRQKTQGTGTVLGDETAKSESIAKSLEMMEGYASLELEYQNSMLTALRNIEIALGGAAKGIMQTIGITGGSAFGTIASSDKSTFGASHTKDITDSGVKFSGSFGQLRAGQGTANQYEVIRTTSDGGMFRSGWTRDDPKYKALAEEAKRPFALIFDNMGDLLVDAGVKLGRDGASLTSAINSIGVNFEVSLRDLKGQELTDALNAGISVAFDKVTKELFPTIAQFQKMGEGLGETLVRVAADVQGVDSVFASMGKSLTTTVTRNMSSIGGWFTGIYNGVAQSVTVVTSMSLEAKERLVEASGGLEKFASQASSFMQNFYSDGERNAATKAKLNPALAQYGLSTEGPNAQKMFRQFVLGLDTSTASGAKTYAMLMDVQQAFKDVTAAAADERADLQKQLDQLTLTRAQLLERERSALDASNRGLWDQVQAAQKAKDAQDAAKTSLGDFISKMGSFESSTKALSASLLVGNLSTLTPEQQYEQLRNQYESTKAAALAGDTTAQGNFSQSLTAFLTASQKINGGDARYSAEFAAGQRDAEMMSQWAAGQVDVAQASLNALNDQVSGINSLNMTMLQMAQSIDNLPADLVATVAQAVLPVDYSRMGSSGNTELLAEVKALNTKIDAQNKLIDGLRADQQKQTGDIITSNATVTVGAAKTVVDGFGETSTNARSRDYKVDLHGF